MPRLRWVLQSERLNLVLQYVWKGDASVLLGGHGAPILIQRSVINKTVRGFNSVIVVLLEFTECQSKGGKKTVSKNLIVTAALKLSNEEVMFSDV